MPPKPRVTYGEHAPEEGKLYLAEAICEAYRTRQLNVRCPTCENTPGKPGFIRDTAGKGTVDGRKRRYFSCQRSSSRRNAARDQPKCQRATCSGYIELARRQLGGEKLVELVAELIANCEPARRYSAALRSLANPPSAVSAKRRAESEPEETETRNKILPRPSTAEFVRAFVDDWFSIRQRLDRLWVCLAEDVSRVDSPANLSSTSPARTEPLDPSELPPPSRFRLPSLSNARQADVADARANVSLPSTLSLASTPSLGSASSAPSTRLTPSSSVYASAGSEGSLPSASALLAAPPPTVTLAPTRPVSPTALVGGAPPEPSLATTVEELVAIFRASADKRSRKAVRSRARQLNLCRELQRRLGPRGSEST